MTEENSMPPEKDFSDVEAPSEMETLAENGLKKAVWFDPAKGNLMQFLGIVIITMGIPFIFFESTRSIGFLLCPLGTALYIVGRFANWYFWYRLQ